MIKCQFYEFCFEKITTNKSLSANGLDYYRKYLSQRLEKGYHHAKPTVVR